MASSRLVAPQGWCIPQAGGDFEHGEKQFRLCHIPMIQNCNLECGKSLETGNHIPIKTKSLEIGNPLSDDSPKTKINQPRRLRLPTLLLNLSKLGKQETTLTPPRIGSGAENHTFRLRCSTQPIH